MANIISYTQSHEGKLKKDQIKKIDPKKRLFKGDNIWNICIMDNIDFKE